MSPALKLIKAMSIPLEKIRDIKDTLDYFLVDGDRETINILPIESITPYSGNMVTHHMFRICVYHKDGLKHLTFYPDYYNCIWFVCDVNLFCKAFDIEYHRGKSFMYENDICVGKFIQMDLNTISRTEFPVYATLNKSLNNNTSNPFSYLHNY